MQNKIKQGLLRKHCCPNVVNDNSIRIKIVGIINTIAFQKARLCAEKLHQHLPFKFSPPRIIEMFQIDWHEFLQNIRRQIGGKIWSLTRTVVVFINDDYIGSDVEFLHYISQFYIFSLPFDIGYYEILITECCKKFVEKSKRKYVYFTFTIDGSIIGSFVFMLYSDLLPLTCQRFLNLCIGYDEEASIYRDSYYINTRVHRIVKNGWLQCGGPASSDQFNEYSCFCNNVLMSDESYCVPHDRRGILSMANDGKHCNKYQFIISLKPNPWMNYFYVAFGQLIDGARTLKVLENTPTYYEHPTKEIVISYCGEYLFKDEPKMETESNIFLKHEEPASIEGEEIKFDDSLFDFYGITPWLDNIVDKIDIRDKASLLMTERYLNGFYCLSRDYDIGMDMRTLTKIQPTPVIKCDTTAKCKLQELLSNFHPDVMTVEDKSKFISEISTIILSYLFYFDNNEFCLRHISMNSHAVIQKVLEIAHKIALNAIAKAEGRSLISLTCGGLQIEKILEKKQVEGILPSEICLFLLQEILQKAIICLIKFIHFQEDIDLQE